METAGGGRLVVAGHGGSGWACVLLGQDWVRPVPVAVADRLCGGHWDGDRAACAVFCRAAAAAAGRGEADPGGAGGGSRGVPAVGQQLGAGHQPHRAQGHRSTAGRCAGPDRAGGRTVRGGGPRPRPGRTGPVGRRGRGAAAGTGDRFPLPRVERVRGAGRGVLLRPRSGHRPGAGADVAARGGRGAAGDVGGVGGGEVVAAAGGSAAADPGGGAGGRAGGGVVAMPGVHPDPGAAG